MLFEVHSCCWLKHHYSVDQCIEEFILCTNLGALKSHFVSHRSIDDFLDTIKFDNRLLCLVDKAPGSAVSKAKCPEKTCGRVIQHLTDVNVRSKRSCQSRTNRFVVDIFERLVYRTNLIYCLFDVFTLFLQHPQIVVRTIYAKFCSYLTQAAF